MTCSVSATSGRCVSAAGRSTTAAIHDEPGQRAPTSTACSTANPSSEPTSSSGRPRASPTTPMPNARTSTGTSSALPSHPIAGKRDKSLRSSLPMKRITQSNLTDGLARNLRDAPCNTAFIGFTGRPTEAADRNTRAVFGEYIDVYDCSHAVENSATVRVYDEAHVANVELSDKPGAIFDIAPASRMAVAARLSEVVRRSRGTHTSERGSHGEDGSGGRISCRRAAESPSRRASGQG